jgi:hypothetical protein
MQVCRRAERSVVPLVRAEAVDAEVRAGVMDRVTCWVQFGGGVLIATGWAAWLQTHFTQQLQVCLLPCCSVTACFGWRQAVEFMSYNQQVHDQSHASKSGKVLCVLNC